MMSRLEVTLRARIAELEARLAELEPPFGGRTLRNFKSDGFVHKRTCKGDYCSCIDPMADDEQTAELVCSDMPGDGDTHKPVIDIDLPCRLVESHTPGHYHLYIDHEMPEYRYGAILFALMEAGVIEEGYYKAWCGKRYTAVRHPDRLAKIDPHFNCVDAWCTTCFAQDVIV